MFGAPVELPCPCRVAALRTLEGWPQLQDPGGLASQISGLPGYHMRTQHKGMRTFPALLCLPHERHLSTVFTSRKNKQKCKGVCAQVYFWVQMKSFCERSQVMCRPPWPIPHFLSPSAG